MKLSKEYKAYKMAEYENVDEFYEFEVFGHFVV